MQNHPHNMNIFNTNTRRLMKNCVNFEAFFADLSSQNFSFDVLTYTETWLDHCLERAVSFEGYVSVMKHKHPVKEGGGLAIFVKDDIQFRIRSDLSFPPEKQSQFDGIFIEFEPNNGQARPLVLGNLYRSPSFKSISYFCQN